MSIRDRDIQITVNDTSDTVRVKTTTYYRDGRVDFVQTMTFPRAKFEAALRRAEIQIPLRKENA